MARAWVTALLLVGFALPGPSRAQEWKYRGCPKPTYPYGAFPIGTCPPPPESQPKCPGDSKIKIDTAVADNWEGTKHPTLFAVDTFLTTRWSTGTRPTAWWYGDLGVAKAFKRVYIAWEVAHATDYNIEVSDNKTAWTVLKEVRGGDGFWDTVDVDGNGRYVRMNGLVRGPTDVNNELFGYSFFDFTVCAEGSGTGVRGGALRSRDRAGDRAWDLVVGAGGYPLGIVRRFDLQGRAFGTPRPARQPAVMKTK